MPAFCSCLKEPPGNGSEGLEEAKGLDSALQGMNLLKTVDCVFASLNLLTTISVEVTKNKTKTKVRLGHPVGKTYLSS